MQNKAYEVRISDWSADVCSSDLEVQDVALGVDVPERLVAARAEAVAGEHVVIGRGSCRDVHRSGGVRRRLAAAVWRGAGGRAGQQEEQPKAAAARHADLPSGRSGTHTYELQSLNRRPSPVSCLKKT